VELPDAEMRIGDVCELHGWRMGLSGRKSKELRRSRLAVRGRLP
jgi:hypothetical protein